MLPIYMHVCISNCYSVTFLAFLLLSACVCLFRFFLYHFSSSSSSLYFTLLCILPFLLPFPISPFFFYFSYFLTLLSPISPFLLHLHLLRLLLPRPFSSNLHNPLLHQHFFFSLSYFFFPFHSLCFPLHWHLNCLRIKALVRKDL